MRILKKQKISGEWKSGLLLLLKLETSLKAELLGMKIKTDTHLKTV